MTKGFVFHPTSHQDEIAAVALTECGTVYMSTRDHVIPGEVIRKPVHHTSGYFKGHGIASDDESYVNFEVLESVHPNTVRAAVKRLGINKPLRRNVAWFKVHGD